MLAARLDRTMEEVIQDAFDQYVERLQAGSEKKNKSIETVPVEVLETGKRLAHQANISQEPNDSTANPVLDRKHVLGITIEQQLISTKLHGLLSDILASGQFHVIRAIAHNILAFARLVIHEGSSNAVDTAEDSSDSQRLAEIERSSIELRRIIDASQAKLPGPDQPAKRRRTG
jgi:hypothetical protein